MSCLTDYQQQFDSLKKIVGEVDEKSKSELPEHTFFLDNINFFTKSFLVTICAYLESFLKDIAYLTIQNYDQKLNGLGIPSNLVQWYWILKNEKKFESRFEEFRLNIEKKDLDNYISGNPYKTIKLFEYIGIDLNKNDKFQELKVKINSIVVKRNNIIHHNDNASDITLSDILDYIESVQIYLMIINDQINLS